MSTYRVSLVSYEKPMESVRKAVELCGGLDRVSADAKVFVKPNIVLWTRASDFPKWGTITTSRVVEDMVVLLKERGVRDIVIGEGIVKSDPKDTETPAHAAETLGYNTLGKRYGVRFLDVLERPHRKVDLGCGVALNFSVDALDSDFVVNIPVLKTHTQTMVTLGIKNLKGLIDIESRKACHSADPEKDLNYMVAHLANAIPPSFTIIDGIYSNERGASVNGKIRRSNILAASADVLSVDMVGTKLLGYEPSQIPHLVHAASDRNRPMDLSDVEIVGESLDALASFHEYSFPFTEDESLPKFMARMGVQGLSFPKYDLSLCTYCAVTYPVIMAALSMAWKGEAWDDVEVLTGKIRKPTPGKKKTVLIGKCMVQANKDNPDINEAIPVRGCPPDTKAIVKAFNKVGIEINPDIIENWEANLGILLEKYKGKPEFAESFFQVR